MVSPTGYNIEPGVATAITNAAWTRIENPNFAKTATLTADQDFWVRWEQPQPAAGAIGQRVWANTYYGNSKNNGALGLDRDNVAIPNYGPVWVRAVAAATTVYSEWKRE